MARSTTAERLRRMIAMLGKLEDGARFSIADVAASLGTTESALSTDLLALSMCGVAPYDPYAMVPLMIEDGYAEVFGDMPAITGPVRLSVAEAAALAAGLQTAGFDSDDPLTARLLEASSQDFDAEDWSRHVRARVSDLDRSVSQTLAFAIDARRLVTIAHAGAERTEAETRTVEPVALFSERDSWYLTAWCHTASDWRTFRVDRIASATLGDETFEPRENAPARTAFDPTGMPRATLRFANAADYIEREWPGGTLVETAADGTGLVSVPIANIAWVARQVVARLGMLEAVEPPELRMATARLAHAMREEVAQACE